MPTPADPWTCPTCRQTILAAESACAACGAAMTAALPVAAAPASARHCRVCGEELAAGASACSVCGETIRGTGRRWRRGISPDDFRPLAPHRGWTLLRLAILSIFCFGIILGPLVWLSANSDLRAMRAGAMDPAGAGMTRVARIVSFVTMALHFLGLLAIAAPPVRIAQLRTW